MKAWLSKPVTVLLVMTLLSSSLVSCRIQTPSPAPVSPSPAPPTQTPTSAPSPTSIPALPDSALTFRGNLAHTGVYAEQGDFGEWVFSTKGTIGSSPVLAGDNLYIGSMTGTDFYALDPSTQQVRWQYTDPVGMFASPAVAEDRVIVATLSGKVAALDATTGGELWSYTVGSPMISSPAVEAGSVYLATQSGEIMALDLSTGEQRWSYETGDMIQSSPAVDDGILVVGCQNSFVYGLDAASGLKKWLYLAEGPVISSVAIQDGIAYFGSPSDGNSFYAVDLQTGKTVWKVKAGGLVSSPAIKDGVIYIGGLDGSVLAGNITDGSLVWAAKTGGLIISSPAVTQDAVYIGSSDGKLYAFDRLTGQEQWTFQTNGDVWTSPAVAGETVFFGSGDGKLYAVNRHGPQLAVAPTATPLPLQPTPTMIPQPPATPRTGTDDLPWWNDRVFYEVFVRSFYDSNADDMGDLKGLIQKLDYLNDGDPTTTTDLGVTGLWLMPIAESPSIHGYDAVDFRQVEQDYGTNADFKQLVQEAHRRGMVVIVDMVMNHTSSENPWFQQSMIPGSEYENWYIWSSADPGYMSPWNSAVWDQVPPGANAPRPYHAMSDYYYALFSPTQPDLNFRNGAVTLEMYDILRYWLEDMGADGFRLDAVRHLIEDGKLQTGTPETHAWLQAFHRYVHSLNPDALTVGEIWQDSPEVARYVGDEVNIAFEFNLAQAILDSLNQGEGSPLAFKLKSVLEVYPEGQFATFLTNHDMARTLTQLGSSTEKAKVAAGLLLTLPGVPFIYYGEEIGLTGPMPDINVRKPMQWDASANAGFTTGEPWQAVGLGYQGVNVTGEGADPNSLLSSYRQLIQLRQSNAALRAGDTFLVDSDQSAVVSYLRASGEENVLVLANLSDQPVRGYKLALDSGPLADRLQASLLSGEGKPASLNANTQGGFDAYTPIAELPPYSLFVIRLEP
jgi:alpha-amylase